MKKKRTRMRMRARMSWYDPSTVMCCDVNGVCTNYSTGF